MYLDELDVGAFLHHNFLCGHFRTAALAAETVPPVL